MQFQVVMLPNDKRSKALWDDNSVSRQWSQKICLQMQNMINPYISSCDIGLGGTNFEEILNELAGLLL
jgi:hypothetical protein